MIMFMKYLAIKWPIFFFLLFTLTFLLVCHFAFYFHMASLLKKQENLPLKSSLRMAQPLSLRTFTVILYIALHSLPNWYMKIML